MKHNIGKSEKIIRIAIGLIMAYLAWASVVYLSPELVDWLRELSPGLLVIYLFIMIYLFITAAIRFCPITNFWDIDTCEWKWTIRINAKILRIPLLLTVVAVIIIGFMWAIESLMGVRVRQLITFEIPSWRGVGSSVWSPDGENVVLLIDREIWIMDDDGGNLRQLRVDLRTDKYIRSFALSPDGEKIVFTTDGRIWVMNSDGTNQRQLTIHRKDVSFPAWSPDGKRIIFNAAKGAEQPVSLGDRQAQIMIFV